MLNFIKKYKILLAVEVVLLVLGIILAVKSSEPEFIIGDAEKTLGTTNGFLNYVSDEFELKPGVYQVRVRANVSEGQSLYVGVSSDTKPFRTLRVNGAVIFPNQKYLDFEVYVLANITDAKVTCNFNGSGEALLESMEVYRVGYGENILLFWIVIGCIALNGLLYLRNGILAGTIGKEQQFVFWALLGGVLLAYFPYLTDYFSSGADTFFHVLRIEGLKESLQQGVRFPVKVQSYWLFEHGYATSVFYGDLFLYIPACLRLLGFSIMASYKMFVFIILVATAWISFYAFRRCTGHMYAALFGSVINLMIPYRIFNFANRGALGENLAMIFMPLVICGLCELYNCEVDSPEYCNAKWPLILGLSGILQSHLLSCELTVVFMLIICAIFFKKTIRKKTFVELVKAALWCLLLNVWFWYPLLHMLSIDRYHLQTVINDSIQERGLWFGEVFQVFLNVGSAQTGLHNTEPVHLGIAVLLMLFVILFVIGGRKITKSPSISENPYDKQSLFWAILTGICVLLSMRFIPWDLLSEFPGISLLVNALQFPTRLFIPATVLASSMATFFVLWLEKECDVLPIQENTKIFIKKGILSVLMILSVASTLYQVNDIAFEKSPIWLYNAENLGTQQVVNGEYLLEGTHDSEFSYHGPRSSSQGLEWNNYEQAGTQINIFVDNQSEEEQFLEVPLIGYKGYVVETGDTTEELPYITEERGAHGDLRIAIPAGYSGDLQISYKGHWSYRVAEVISLITLISLCGYGVFKRRKQWTAKS